MSDHDDWLRDRIAEAARTVHIRLGPNALRLAQDGQPIPLSGGEADDVALAVMPVIAEYVEAEIKRRQRHPAPRPLQPRGGTPGEETSADRRRPPRQPHPRHS